MAAVSNSTTTGAPKTQNRGIHFLCRSRLANEEAVSLSIVRHQSACYHFRRTTGHTVSIRNVERSCHILRMPLVIQGACPLLIPFILSDASQVPGSRYRKLESTWTIRALIRWDQKAGLPRDAIRSQ